MIRSRGQTWREACAGALFGKAEVGPLRQKYDMVWGVPVLRFGHAGAHDCAAHRWQHCLCPPLNTRGEWGFASCPLAFVLWLS